MARLSPLKRPVSALKHRLATQKQAHFVNSVTYISNTTTTNSENTAQFYAGGPRNWVERGRKYDGV